MVRDSAAGDDLVQETFLRIWTHAEQLGVVFARAVASGEIDPLGVAGAKRDREVQRLRIS